MMIDWKNSDSNTKKWEPPESLVEFLNRAERTNKKLVYIGFGSIVVQDPIGLSKTIVEAVGKSGVMAIVSKGWSDRIPSEEKDKKTLKAEERDNQIIKETEEKDGLIYNVKSIPHDWLFTRIHAVCHHGGAGTTGMSLRNGLPTIIRPFFGDQVSRIYMKRDRGSLIEIEESFSGLIEWRVWDWD
jgi:sterol 3beta-glucosyltransferase